MNTLKPILRTLVKALVDAEELIFADQNSPRPSLPYWTMRLSVQRKVGTDERGSGVTALGIQTVKGVREGTLQLQRYGADSDLRCADVRDSLSKQTVRDAWRVAKIAAYDVGDVLNVPYKLDNSQLEPGSRVDIFIRFGTSLNDDVSAIETVQTEVKFDSKPDLTETLTVVL